MIYFPLVKVIFAACALVASAKADIVGGRRTYINYNQCGLWNDNATRRGFITEECCPVDATYPGAPWQQLSVSYNNIGSSPNVFKGNYGGCNYQLVSKRLLDDGSGLVGIEHVFHMGVLALTKTEEWDFDGQVVHISFKAKYAMKDCNCAPVSNLSVMHAVDPDQDRAFPSGSYATLNDVIYSGGDGLFAEAVGQRSCQTFGYGICSTKQPTGSSEEVGFTPWISAAPTSAISDPGGNLGDLTMHYQHRERLPMQCGDEREFHFIVTWGRCYTQARENFIKAHGRFCRCNRLPRLSIFSPARRCRGQCPCQNKRGSFSCSCSGNPCSGIRRLDPNVADNALLSLESIARKEKFLCGDDERTSRHRSDVASLLRTNENLRQERSARCDIASTKRPQAANPDLRLLQRP